MGIDPCHPVAQIELIALATDDVEGLRDFYLQLGAVASAPSSDPDTGLRSCMLDFCGVRLELFEPLAGGEGAVDVTRSRLDLCTSVLCSGRPTPLTSSANRSPRPATACSSCRIAPASLAVTRASSSTPTGTE